MRLFLLTAALVLAAACNNPGSLPDVEEGRGASQPAAEPAAPQQSDGPESDQPDDDFPEIIIPEQPIADTDEAGETDAGDIEAFDPEPAGDPAPAEEAAEEAESGAFDLRPPGITGGPCAYETSIVTATVVESDEDGALFESAEGEEFYVPRAYVRPVPGVGETLTLERDRITQGTCTPEIYRRAGP